MQILEEVSTITAKGQTTVPKAVRKVLGVNAGDRIAFRVEGQQVSIHTVEAEHIDPLVGRFLQFLASDMQRRPGAIKPLSRAFAARMASLTKGKRVELDEPIEGSVDL